VLNFTNHGIQIFLDIIIPEAQNFVSTQFKEMCALRVVFFSFQVSPTIQFDYEFTAGSAEVHDVIPNGMLSSKFNPVKFFSSQVCP